MGANSSQSVPKTQREWSQSAIFLLGAMTGARAIRDPEFPNFINDSFDVVKLENILQRLGHGDPDDYDHQLLECTAGLGFRLPAVNNTQGSNGVTTAQHNNVQRPPGQPDNAATPAIQSSSSVETSEDVIAQMEACTASAAYREQYNETSARR
ncbi:hypothetical protein F5Y18DRAFT_382122 [Xylariaceae sp. FL1019]|nr:hypothetical protein F5Y18DRAFT_382122 [Xylariaceae sp. FL1019]